MDGNEIRQWLDQGTNLLENIPSPQQLLDWAGQFLRILVLAGPVMMMVMGLIYSFAAPKEANYRFGFRCYYGMGSVEAWQFTQRLAGTLWTALGAVLLVAMLVVGRTLGNLEPMEMFLRGVMCVLVQAVAILLASILIRITVFFRFDRHGVRRKEKRKHPKYL